MQLSPLTAISPIDGRYRSKAESLDAYFSEYALIRYRVHVETEYFIALTELPLPQLAAVPATLKTHLRRLARELTLEQAQRVKDIEAVTNHDVKAVEYFIKEELDTYASREDTDVTPRQMDAWKEFVHFGLTSQDINNTAVPLSLRDATRDVLLPAVDSLIATLSAQAEAWAGVPMLAHTHGQPASPTRVGKELQVYVARLTTMRDQLAQARHTAKFGGATGGLNAHHVAYPDTDWQAWATSFVEQRLGLGREYPTTQISHYDQLAALLDTVARICTIVLDLDRDIWQYVAMGYFRQRVKAGEVGSSAMPHKVNPIDFENSEGNMGIAVALLTHLARKLPVSRMQRDLTDSTVLRALGMPYAHALIAIQSTLRGLGKLQLAPETIAADLEANWAVVAEGIQTILRREGYPHPYETLKALTRTGRPIDAATIRQFITDLDVSPAVRQELLSITPSTYTGI